MSDTHTTTFTATTKFDECEHKNGWYVTVKMWWIFEKRIYVCSDCGYHEESQ